MGRFFGAVLGVLALAMSAAPAKAVYIKGPGSGQWQRYQVSFSPDVSGLYLSIYGNLDIALLNEYGGYDVFDYYYADGCNPAACVAPIDEPRYVSGLRYVTFVDNVARFSVYVPRSYFKCDRVPPLPGKSGVCGMTYHDPDIFLDYLDGTAGEVVLLASGTVPEPASWAMLIAGFGVVGAAMRRRRSVVVHSGSARAR